MYVLPVVASLLLLLGANATSVLGVRDLPGRYVHSKTVGRESLADPLSADLPFEAASLSPDTVVVLRPDYIRGFLVFDSFNLVQAAAVENGPLNSKFTNLDRHLSDETNLKSWTRYLVEHADDAPDLPAVPSVDEVDVDIGRFTDYLVSSRGFLRTDLGFLQAVPLALSYDEIEDELAEIKNRHAKSSLELEPKPVVENMAAKPAHTLPLLLPFLLACL